jgi:PKD repeat protein
VASSSGSPDGSVRVSDANGGGCTGNAPSGSCSYTPNGTGSRTITATYDGNASFAGSSDTEEHTVSEPPPPNQPPTAAFSNEACVAGQPCQFTDQSTDDGQIVAWEWDFSDSGATSAVTNPAHTFSAAGVYRVRLRVTDNQGARGEVERDIEVTAPNTAPTVTAPADPAGSSLTGQPSSS